MDKTMKKKEKTMALVVGGALFLLALIFAIGILLRILDFGTGTPGRGGFLYGLGTMVASAYGISSILIPVFLLAAGWLCLDSRWSVQRALCLLVSVVPFFTIVVIEHSVRDVLATDYTPLASAKVCILLLMAVLLVAAEYLLAIMGAGLVKGGASLAEVRGAVASAFRRFVSIPVGRMPRPAADGRTERESAVVADAEDDSFSAPTICEDFFEDGQPARKVLVPQSGPDAPLTFKARVVGGIRALIQKGRQQLDDFLEFGESHGEGEVDTVDDIDLEAVYANGGVAVKVSGRTARAEGVDGMSAPCVGQDVGATTEALGDSGAHGVARALDVVETSPATGRDAASAPVAPCVDMAGPVKVYAPDTRDLSFAEVELEDGFTNAGEEPVAVDTADAESADDAAQVAVDAVPAVEELLYADEDATLDGDDVIAQFEQGNMTQDDFDTEGFAEADEADAEEGAQDCSLLSELGSVFAKMDEDVQRLVARSAAVGMDAASVMPDVPQLDAAVRPGVVPVPQLEPAVASVAPDELEEPASVHQVHQIDDSLVLDGEPTDVDATLGAVSADDAPSALDEELLDDEDAGEVDALDDGEEEAPADAVEEMTRSIADAGRAVVTDASGVTRPLSVEVRRTHGPYAVSTDLLTTYEDNPYWIVDAETREAAESLKGTLAEFKIDAEVTDIKKGPVVTMFELLPAPGVKLNRIVALQDNIALRLAASSVRIVAPIPGKHAVGIEVPNKNRAIISIRECLEQERPEWKKMGVPVVLGKDIQGETKIMDLVKTPHLLIAGSTGAGKSVCVNSMIMSMLYKRSPSEVKLILIDPKIVELKLYNDIPHLLTPVITEPKKAMQALQYCLCEMERRYALLDGMGVREITSYNKKIVDRHIATERLPYLIVIIDEFADLMATTGKQLEVVVARLAAMSRAVGIHLVLATQRPSVDVITGLIKANIPSRIAFMVASKMDSRIILDQPGADKLLGKGDMLFVSAASPFPSRIQGTFVSDQEVENVVNAVKAWGEPEYIDDEIFVDDDDEDGDDASALMEQDGEDPLFEKALDIVVQAGKASASYIQRRLKIGYNRAARLVELMEERGFVGPANGSKAREIIHMP